VIHGEVAQARCCYRAPHTRGGDPDRGSATLPTVKCSPRPWGDPKPGMVLALCARSRPALFPAEPPDEAVGVGPHTGADRRGDTVTARAPWVPNCSTTTLVKALRPLWRRCSARDRRRPAGRQLVRAAASAQCPVSQQGAEQATTRGRQPARDLGIRSHGKHVLYSSLLSRKHSSRVSVPAHDERPIKCSHEHGDVRPHDLHVLQAQGCLILVRAWQRERALRTYRRSRHDLTCTSDMRGPLGRRGVGGRAGERPQRHPGPGDARHGHRRRH
jgi:hypothetical protein